jgi:hypothetical protein
VLRYRLLLFALMAVAALSACASATPPTAQSTTAPAASASAQATVTAPARSGSPAAGSPLAMAGSYYHDLEVHNYDAAAAYLSTNATNIEGQHLTRGTFIQLARGRDQESGSITNFDSLASTDDPSLIIMSISRTSEQAYHSHLQFKQEGGSWKIVSLDVI